MQNNAQFYVTVKTHLSSLAWIIAWFNLGSSWDKLPLPGIIIANSWKSFGGKTKSQCPLNCWRHLEFKFARVYKVHTAQLFRFGTIALLHCIHWSIEPQYVLQLRNLHQGNLGRFFLADIPGKIGVIFGSISYCNSTI